mgnify:CR=1 FL=1|jgi:PAS domain S-box-containing protein|tara:strand:- start:30829 stop:33831 length:3003 start_codon:yes stop_codon:yes gene_type:complete
MNFGLWQLFSIGFVYLSILFGLAYATDKGWIPSKVVRHPAVYVFSLGVFAGSIAFYGTLHLAYHYGGGYLLYFAGASAVFLVSPLLLAPLKRIAKTHNLGSLADVFAFRYPSPWTGGLVATLMLIGVLPLFALQIQAVSVTVHILNQEFSQDILAITFCLFITLFAILFGARHLSNREKHEGLVMAIALESITKLLAISTIALFSLYSVFGGMADVSTWLVENLELLRSEEAALTNGQARSLLLIFFAAAIGLPHIYHMGFTENSDASALATARWGFPLYLLCFSLCIPPILWAAIKLNVDTDPEYFVLGIGISSQNDFITMLGFVGGLSAASSILIVITPALASMTLNHVILPIYRPGTSLRIYQRLLNMRRALIAAIILAGYGLYRMLDVNQNLISLGIVSFVAVLQFLPGLAGTFLWRGANRNGFIAGLGAGFLVWFFSLMLPLLNDMFSNMQIAAVPLLYDLNETVWHKAVQLSLGANLVAFVLISYLTRPTLEEQKAADDCLAAPNRPAQRRELEASSVHEIKQSLAMALGRSVSDREVDLAVAELRIAVDEQRPYALYLLRDKMEKNLSSMLGQTIAHRIIGSFLPFKKDSSSTFTENVYKFESRIEEYQTQLTGLAAEVDGLRRHHRQTLQELPTAVCSIGVDGEVLTWNHAMTELTKLESEAIVGSPSKTIGEPWSTLLTEFSNEDVTHVLKKRVETGDSTRWLNLHKAAIEEAISRQDNLVIVIEDITENKLLEDKLLHSERLASIGQLAASVAHEIGNPITGIACLAQNIKLETDNAEMKEMSDQILDQTDRVSAILQSLVNFAHSGAQATHPMLPVQIDQVIAEAIQLLTLSPKNKEITFSNQCDLGLFTQGDSQKLCQVFVNLLSNARDASKADDKIVISSRVDADRAIIEIIDEGHGIPPTNISKVFEPFFTTKEPGQGTGLGLAIVYSIIEEHFGEIQVESPAGQAGHQSNCGTRVTIRLPRYHHRTDLYSDPTALEQGPFISIKT